MRSKLLTVSALIMATLVGCSGKDGGSAGGGAMLSFVKTQDGSPLEIKAELFDTPQAKEFSTTGKNLYWQRGCDCGGACPPGAPEWSSLGLTAR